jgi:hypothetical protein
MPEFKNPLIFLWKTPPRGSGTPFFRWFSGSARPGGAIAEGNANACYLSHANVRKLQNPA